MEIEDISWDCRWMSSAYLAARKSKDRRTQVGAVVVSPDNIEVVNGYNGPVRGYDGDDDPFIQSKEEKRKLFEHAERNSLYNAAWVGASTRGATMYVTLPPCMECARAIVQGGIATVRMHAGGPGHEALSDDELEAQEFLRRRGVAIEYYSGPVLIDAVRHDGAIFRLPTFGMSPTDLPSHSTA